MTGLRHNLNYVLNAFVKRTPGELRKQNKENMDKIMVLQMAIRTDKC